MPLRDYKDQAGILIIDGNGFEESQRTELGLDF